MLTFKFFVILFWLANHNLANRSLFTFLPLNRFTAITPPLCLLLKEEEEDEWGPAKPSLEAYKSESQDDGEGRSGRGK